MPTSVSDDIPDGASSTQSNADDHSQPRFHQRDPLTISEQAALGEGGPTRVAQVQDFYRQIFELVGDQAWADAPVGPLGEQWRGVGGAQSTLYLMNVATVLVELMRNASPGVGRTITQRLRTMLRPPDDHAYEETLVELEVGGILASAVGPVLLEPLVPVDWQPGKGPQPKSPDYGLRVPEGLVTFEVTVWHWEAYAAWHRMNETIYTALSARVRKRGVARMYGLSCRSDHLRKPWNTYGAMSFATACVTRSPVLTCPPTASRPGPSERRGGQCFTSRTPTTSTGQRSQPTAARHLAPDPSSRRLSAMRSTRMGSGTQRCGSRPASPRCPARTAASRRGVLKY